MASDMKFLGFFFHMGRNRYTFDKQALRNMSQKGWNLPEFVIRDLFMEEPFLFAWYRVNSLNL